MPPLPQGLTRVPLLLADIVQAHYQPVGFLSLAHGPCQGLFEEVLLLLQPLSLLPFSVDLLFQHRLQQISREQQHCKELLLRTQQGLALSAHSTLQLMRTRGGHQGWGPEEEEEQDPGHRGEATEGRAKGVGAPSGGGQRAEEGVERREAPEVAAEQRKDKQASWWYQLMQSSQVYIEGSAAGGTRVIRYERKKKAGPGVAVKQQAEARKGPPPREGVVEGAEACPITEGPAPEAARKPPEPPGKEEAKEKGRPFWMGSPPDSVLTELKGTKEKEQVPTSRQGPPGQGSAGSPKSTQPKWGHLFGSRKGTHTEPKQTSRYGGGVPGTLREGGALGGGGISWPEGGRKEGGC